MKEKLLFKNIAHMIKNIRTYNNSFILHAPKNNSIWNILKYWNLKNARKRNIRK